jgi:hypothetical protein
MNSRVKRLLIRLAGLVVAVAPQFVAVDSSYRLIMVAIGGLMVMVS